MRDYMSAINAGRNAGMAMGGNRGVRRNAGGGMFNQHAMDSGRAAGMAMASGRDTGGYKLPFSRSNQSATYKCN